MTIIVWVPLLACPAVRAQETLLDKPAVAPAYLRSYLGKALLVGRFKIVKKWWSQIGRVMLQTGI